MEPSDVQSEVSQLPLEALLTEPRGWLVLLAIGLSMLSALVPYFLAIWMGRRFQTRWIYVWGALAAVLLSMLMSIVFQLALELQPALMMDMLDVLYGWIP